MASASKKNGDNGRVGEWADALVLLLEVLDLLVDRVEESIHGPALLLSWQVMLRLSEASRGLLNLFPCFVSCCAPVPRRCQALSAFFYAQRQQRERRIGATRHAACASMCSSAAYMDVNERCGSALPLKYVFFRSSSIVYSL